MTNYDLQPIKSTQSPVGESYDNDETDRIERELELYGTKTPPVDAVAIMENIGVVLKSRGIISPDGKFLGVDHALQAGE
ncbi:MAG: hypothetical protein WDN66_00930 [Candidatus Saccharibacteria bacterium]